MGQASSNRLIESAYNAAVARGQVELANELQQAWLNAIDQCSVCGRPSESRRFTIALLMIIAQAETKRNQLPLTALANIKIIARSALSPVDW